VLTVLALAAVCSQRWGWTGALVAMLVVVHPSAVFAVPWLAAPLLMHLWERRPSARERTLLIGGTAAAYVALILALVGHFKGLPIQSANLPELLRLLVDTLTDLSGWASFLSGFGLALDGGLVYAGMVEWDTSLPVAAPAIVVSMAFVAGGGLLWNLGRTRAFGLWVGLAVGLISQYLTQGTDATAILKERYVLWAAVPACIAASTLVSALFSRAKWQGAAILCAAALGVAGLMSFYSSYTVPFERGGGKSRVLDYRSASPEVKEQVVAAVQRLRAHPETVTDVFVGEARLQLGLRYLASADRSVQIRNLDRVLYRHYQKNDAVLLDHLLARQATNPTDVFLVDYLWDEGPGRRSPQPRTSSPVLEGLAVRWTVDLADAIRTPDGIPLIGVWRLAPR
jgi:hypothetical protein